MPFLAVLREKYRSPHDCHSSSVLSCRGGHFLELLANLSGGSQAAGQYCPGASTGTGIIQQGREKTFIGDAANRARQVPSTSAQQVPTQLDIPLVVELLRDMAKGLIYNSNDWIISRSGTIMAMLGLLLTWLWRVIAVFLA